MKTYDLYIFDADGTVCDRDTGELLPNTLAKIQTLPTDSEIAIATNQGGVGLRYWMESQGYGEPEKYPNAGDVVEQYAVVGRKIGASCVYASFAYQGKKSELWAPNPPGFCVKFSGLDGARYGCILSVFDSAAPPVFASFHQSWRKPAGGMINQVLCDGMGESAVFIGDRPEDEEAAKSAGVDFIHADEFFCR